jgi:hypothetical protein
MPSGWAQIFAPIGGASQASTAARTDPFVLIAPPPSSRAPDSDGPRLLVPEPERHRPPDPSPPGGPSVVSEMRRNTADRTDGRAPLVLRRLCALVDDWSEGCELRALCRTSDRVKTHPTLSAPTTPKPRSRSTGVGGDVASRYPSPRRRGSQVDAPAHPERLVGLAW